MIEIVRNIYGGVIIDFASCPRDKDELHEGLLKLIASCNKEQLIWCTIPIDYANHIPIFTKLNFKFHHCDEERITIIKKVVDEAFVPTSKNFIVGVGAIVIQNNQLLVTKNKFSENYNLPGGHIEVNESITDALEREVFEETGINVEFESIANLGHFKNGQFGESNLYIVCTAKALSVNINIIDTSEITEAMWFDVHEFIHSDLVNNYNSKVVEAVINNNNLKLTRQEIKLKASDGEVFF